MEPSRQQHEETIVPVKPGLRASAASRPKPVVRQVSGPWRTLLFVVVPGILVIGFFFVAFVALPRWLDDSRKAPEEPAATAAEPAPAAPEKPKLSPEQLAALEKQAEALLAPLLTQQKRLGELHADSWGGDQWQRYTELATTGDDAYLAKDFQVAVTSYSDATKVGEELLARSVEIVESAFAAGLEAFQAGNATVAIGQFDLVLGIEPEHPGALAARARAERLNDVLALVQRGDAERQAGEPRAALESYAQALAIDASWEPAIRATNEINVELRNAEFERAMSQGFTALAAKEFVAADEQFAAALKLRPQSREAQEGRTQAAEGAKLDNIALAEVRALAFERRELWQDAIAQYRAALATDPNLQFALTGIERSEKRASLEAKLKNLIENPTLLFSDTVLADSRKLIDEASAQEERGPRLQEQIDGLSRLVSLASTPIKVELRSDQLTEVTLYRVGALGAFTAKEVELRPGTYTAIGSRNGFRDVRQTFTVLPGRELPPVSVICVESI